VIETREDLIQFVDQHNIPGPVVQNTLGVSKQTWCNARKGRTWTKRIPAKLHVGVAELVQRFNGTDVLDEQEEISAPVGRPKPEESPPVADEQRSLEPVVDWSDRAGADDDQVDVAGAGRNPVPGAELGHRNGSGGFHLRIPGPLVVGAPGERQGP